MRTTIWNFKPKGSLQSKYTTQEGREEGLAYIEQLKKEDTVLEVIEEPGRFVIILE